MPHAIHEHVRILLRQWALPPLVNPLIHLGKLVRQRLRRHTATPQQLADVIDAPGGHARQIHLDQCLLDGLLTTPVAFNDGGLVRAHP